MLVSLRSVMFDLSAKPTRDGDNLAVDPATVLGGQEANNTGNIFGGSAAAERAVVGHHLLDGGGFDVGGSTTVRKSVIIIKPQRQGITGGI